MERIRLTSNEKRLLRYLTYGGDIYGFDMESNMMRNAAKGLRRKELVNVAFVEGGKVEDIRLTEDGKNYISEYPYLINPIDWKWVVSHYPLSSRAMYLSPLLTLHVRHCQPSNLSCFAEHHRPHSLMVCQRIARTPLQS